MQKIKQNHHSQTAKEIKMFANSMTYMVQDLLDGLGRGGRFDFKDMEKDFRKSLVEFRNSSK